MAHIQVKSELLINARPENVYAVLSDYKSKRPQILTPNFLNYTLEKGGQGQGTIVRYRLHAANRERDYRFNIDEPVKGKVIIERDTNSSLVNTWTISPVLDGTRTRVSIINEWEGGSGVKGFFERTFAPLGLKSIYGKILGMVSLAASGETSDTVGNIFADDDENHSESQLAVFLLISASIVGVAFFLNYLRQKRS